MTDPKYLKLRSGEGQHYDRDIGFHIRGREIQPEPAIIPPGSLTAQRITMAALVYASPEEVAADLGKSPNTPEGSGGDETTGPDNDREESGAEDSPTTPEALAQARDLVIERRIETLMAENTVRQLLAAAIMLGLKPPPKGSKQKLASMIAVAEWQREHGK